LRRQFFTLTVGLTLALQFSYGAGADPKRLPPADPKRLMKDVRELSSPKYEGRLTGTAGLNLAAEYIEKSFAKSGLRKPFVENGVPSYRQKFLVTTNTKLGPKNTLRINGQEYTVAKDFVPRIFSSSGSVSGEMVFVGYSITASEYHYDDYAGLDVTGKIVVALRYEPQDTDESSVWEGKKRTRHASLDAKAINAKMHGAAGVILINNPVTYPEEREKLDEFANQSGPADLGIPVVQLRADLAEKWFNGSGRDLAGIVKAIDKLGGPQSFRFPAGWRAEMTVDVERELSPAWNVAAFLPGESSEYVVLGAHYDHIGYGRQFSMAPQEAGKLHPGADDNASGTAVVMEMGRIFAKLPKPKRGILFVAFAGEELGLLGSGHLVKNLPFPVADCAAMVNMDMVGRMRDGKFFLAGASTGNTLRQAIDLALEGEPGLSPDLGENLNIGGSDHSSFTAREIPALFFFSGLHEDYHKPSDTVDKIDPLPFGRLATIVGKTTHALANDVPRPQFQRPAVPAVRSSGGGSGSGGYGPYFGSVPDFGAVEGGVRLADIRAGSPAEQGGLKPGDILIEFDGKPVTNLEEYTYLLRSKQAGEEITVKVKRGNDLLTFRVILSERR
jgi:hypothetical protein